MPVKWDPYNARMIQFNLGINGGVISLPYVFKYVIDTPEFQRLRSIHQLGVAHLVFPQADHSRFVHSLGTASLAYKFMMELINKKLDGKKIIDGNDVLAVSLAGLIHDLGHGPFSHMYEEVFAEASHERHETLSIKIFDKILADHEKVKHEFSAFFDDNDFQLVRQLIDPPDYCNDDKKWPLVVDKEKAFLFSIISNSLNGLDVDKLDYLIRDSERSGVAVTINKNVVELLFKNTQIIQHPLYDFSWIAFADKYTDDVIAIFKARKRLHEALYNHRNSVIVSEMVKRALQCAGDELIILGTNDNHVLLKDCANDLTAYIKLNDSVLDLIRNYHSTSPKILQAKQIIRKIEMHQLPRIIAKLDNLTPQTDEFENEVRNALLESGNVADDDLITVMKVFHFGKGYHNPVGDVIFFGRNINELVRHSEDISCSRTCLFVFGPENCSNEAAAAIYEKLTSFAKTKEFEAPTKMFI